MRRQRVLLWEGNGWFKGAFSLGFRSWDVMG